MAKEIEFKIFTKNKGLHITVNIVVYSFLFISLGIAYIADRYLNERELESMGQSGGILSCILMIYFKITQSFTRESLRGDLNKSIVFRTSEILIHDKVIQLSEIKKIEFLVGNYFDKLSYRAKGDLNPGRTNGTSNTFKATLLDGQIIRVNFQLMYEGEFLKMKELLLKYYSENKIHFLRLIEYLGIDKYEDIQEFKKSLPLSSSSEV